MIPKNVICIIQIINPDLTDTVLIPKNDEVIVFITSGCETVRTIPYNTTNGNIYLDYTLSGQNKKMT